MRLNELGYDCGKADGVMGPKTVAAIRAYERDRALPVNGRATAALLNTLEAEPTP